MTHILNTRAVLKLFKAFADTPIDANGNPIVWGNRYSCRTCTSEQIEWASLWSSKCDEQCPNCGKTQSPCDSIWMGPKDPPFLSIWELLPEAGSDLRAKTADKVKKLIEEMDADAEQCHAMIGAKGDGKADTVARIMAMEPGGYVAFDPKKMNIEDVILNARQLVKTEAVLKAEKMLDFCNEITQRAAPVWAWNIIDGLLGLGLGDYADLSAVAMKFATENPEYAEITREDAKRAAGVL